MSAKLEARALAGPVFQQSFSAAERPRAPLLRKLLILETLHALAIFIIQYLPDLRYDQTRERAYITFVPNTTFKPHLHCSPTGADV